MSFESYCDIVEDSIEKPLDIDAHFGSVVCGTDVGVGYKDENEDSAVVCTEEEGYAVVDGMGGPPHGKEAGAILAEAIRDGFKESHTPETIQENAAEEMKEAGIEDGGAVYVAFQIRDGNLHVFQAGDAKLVVVKEDGSIRFETEDERMMMMLSNAVQGSDHGRASTYPPVELEEGDTILAATDGLWDNIRPREAASLMHSMSPQTTVTQLGKMAKKAMENASGPTNTGKPDNLTLLAYYITGVS